MKQKIDIPEEKKVTFIRRNLEISERAFLAPEDNPEDVNKLILKAVNKFGYSGKTYKKDIYNGLRKVYFKYFVNNMEKV